MGKIRKSKEVTTEKDPMASNNSPTKKLKTRLNPRTTNSWKTSSESAAREREKALRILKWLKVTMQKHPWRKKSQEKIALSWKPKEEEGATSLPEEKKPKKKKKKQRHKREKMMKEMLKIVWDQYNQTLSELNVLLYQHYQLRGIMKIQRGHRKKQLRKKGNIPYNEDKQLQDKIATLCNQGSEEKKEVITDFHQVKGEVVTHFSQDNQDEKEAVTHFDPNSPMKEVKFTQIDQDKQVKGVVSHFSHDKKVNEMITHCCQARQVKEWWITLYYQEEKVKEERVTPCYQEKKVKGERISLWFQENRVEKKVITIFRQGKNLMEKMNSITAQEQEAIGGSNAFTNDNNSL